MNIISLKNKFLEVTLSDLGACVLSIKFDEDEMVLSADDKNYYKENSACLGAIVGRTAGRIENGEFELNQKKYQLTKNFKNKHNLHGNKIFQQTYNYEVKDNQVIFSYLDQECEYPGDVLITIKYELVNSSLLCEIKAIPTVDTIINMTNHIYFNLNSQKTILDHQLQIPAKNVWMLNQDSLPQTKVEVENTVFDFQTLTTIKKNKQFDEQFAFVRYIDHPYELIENEEIILYEPESKRKLIISTNQQYVVCYTGNYLDEEDFTHQNKKVTIHQGICLEPQALPNAINIDGFHEKTIVRANQPYENKIKYTFEKSIN